AWLSYDPANPDAHAASLRRFLGGGELDPDVGFTRASGRAQQVVWTAVAGDATAPDGLRTVTVAVALDSARGQVQYVSVPVARAPLAARDASGAPYTLRYELAVVKRDRWYVAGLKPAAEAAAEKGVTR